MVRAQESTSPAAARSYSGHSRRDPPNDDKGVTMRFGNWRGVTLALALGSALATIPTTTAFANPFHHDIPREVEAVDVNTGGPYYAPPVPYGHYAKDGAAMSTRRRRADRGPPRQAPRPWRPRPCGDGGAGTATAAVPAAGPDAASARVAASSATAATAAAAATRAAGRVVASSRGTATSRTGRASAATTVAGAPPGSPRPGSWLLPAGHHFQPAGADRLGAVWRGGLRPQGSSSPHARLRAAGMAMAVAANAAGTAAAPAEGVESVTSAAAAAGRDAGSAASSGTSRASSAADAAAPVAASAARRSRSWAALLHKNKIKYFVGPGGPVPITPGYVPYVITTRSPRDFLAFPPFTP